TGQCGVAKEGSDQHNDCAQDTSTGGCGNDGFCDGAGACRKYDSNHVCEAASCVSTTFHATRTCLSGVCQAGQTQDCGLSPCSTSGCATSCTADTGCVGQSYCA